MIGQMVNKYILVFDSFVRLSLFSVLNKYSRLIPVGGIKAKISFHGRVRKCMMQSPQDGIFSSPSSPSSPSSSSSAIASFNISTLIILSINYGNSYRVTDLVHGSYVFSKSIDLYEIFKLNFFTNQLCLLKWIVIRLQDNLSITIYMKVE